MKAAKLSHNGLEAVLEHNGRTERLLVKDYPYIKGFEPVFAQFCAFHLLAPHLPKNVISNFPISNPMIKLINKMYSFEGEPSPRISSPKVNIAGIPFKTSNDKAVISYSAGKDSMWNLWWAQEEFGKDNVLAAHISGLNRSNSSDETRYALRQSKKFDFSLEMLQLCNGSGGKGYQVMRSRDMFMVGILIPYALNFGASNIIIEGFGEDVRSSEPFTGHEQNMLLFNKTLKEMNIPIRVKWRNRKEMDVVKDLYINKPDWMSEVCNCFSPSHYKIALHNSWERRTPSIRLYDSQCGSCVKCRIINIGRILYDPNFEATEEDITYYIKSTEKWYAEHKITHNDMIGGSFLEALTKAAKIHDIDLSKI
ncbi:hypothetical protein JW756_04515 [Candidatus Woesearchaeota archaeon]|nr:hypothetical protein [Candidatus Woesearchaeota archaeon]